MAASTRAGENGQPSGRLTLCRLLRLLSPLRELDIVCRPTEPDTYAIEPCTKACSPCLKDEIIVLQISGTFTYSAQIR